MSIKWNSKNEPILCDNPNGGTAGALGCTFILMVAIILIVQAVLNTLGILH